MLPGPGRRVLALCCALLVVTGSWLAPWSAAAAEAGKLVLVDLLALRFRTIRLPKDPGCPACGSILA